MTARRPAWTLLVALCAAGCGAETAKPAQTAPAAPASAPVIPVKKAADWCAEHGVAESICTRCNEELTAKFKETGDWCEKHALPLSQCVECDPSLAAKLAAMKPK